MSTELSEQATDWDSVRNALSAIRASHGEFRSLVFGALDNIEQMGDELLAHELQNEHEDVDQQIAHLIKVIGDLSDFLSENKRMASEERLGWAKEMRHLRSQFQSLKKKRNDLRQQQDAENNLQPGTV